MTAPEPKDRKSFTPQILKNLFPDDERRIFFDYLNACRSNLSRFEWDGSVFLRHQVHNPTPFKKAHAALLELAESVFGEKLKASYCFLSMYSNKGTCPIHTDRPQCVWTIDYCLSQKKPWPIYVEKVPYLLQENDALCYSGATQEHYRNQIDFDNFVDMVFFHFVPASFEGSLD